MSVRNKMSKNYLAGGLLMLIVNLTGIAQKTCTSNPTTISADTNFGSITWTASGGAAVAECNDMADGLITFTGNVIVDLANNKSITISNDVNITGSFPVSGGSGSVLSVTGGSTLHVTGDLGDAGSNGVAYSVPTTSDHIIVEGTLYGKNNNAFTGNGTITGGSLNVKNGSTCGSPCPVEGGFTSCSSNDTFCNDFSVMPVTLVDFTAAQKQNLVLLKWSTASETNFDYFSVQRSSNGMDFSTLSKIKGYGTTADTHHYFYQDQDPFPGKSYYRLKTTDFDGHEETSKLISMYFFGPKSIKIFPQPAHDQIIVKLNFEHPDPVFIMVLDLSGAEVIKLQTEKIETQLPLDLAPGTYIIQVNSGENKLVDRLIIE